MTKIHGIATEVKMNPEIKTKWLAALRSGEYLQGRGSLKSHSLGKSRYCCLGVLGEILLDGQSWPANYVDEATEYQSWKCVQANGCTTNYLAGSLATAAGLPEETGDTDSSPQGILGRMNDRGDSFAQIADWIEENL